MRVLNRNSTEESFAIGSILFDSFEVINSVNSDLIDTFSLAAKA